ncbi:MAG: response regulator transcription factor [Dehalococcoidia bacterium]
MRIAIAESEPVAADILVFAAQRRGHQPVCVPNVTRLFERLPFEPVVAVLSFPDLDGDTVGQIERLATAFPHMGIFVITERITRLTPIVALRAGAHDVIYSPYNPFEVIVRAERWLASRATVVPASHAVGLGDLDVDLEAYTAIKNGVPLQLTKLERRLLYCLCQHHPNVATIDRLLAFGWEALDDPDAGLLKTHISHIRRKLRQAGGEPLEIISHQSVGYAMRVQQSQQIAS